MHHEPPGPGTALLKSTTPEKSGSSASRWLTSGSLLGPSAPRFGSAKTFGTTIRRNTAQRLRDIIT